MLKSFGLIFISLLVASAITILGVVYGKDFSVSYAVDHSLEILATIFALNVATATFLIGGLLNIEERAKKNLFDGARREIKHNIYAMSGLFGLNLVLVALIGESVRFVPGTKIELNDVLGTLVVAILVFYIYLLLEIISAEFKIKIPKE